MSVRVTIEAASKAEAELIAERLPVKARARTWRGLGVIRLDTKTLQQTNDLLDVVWQGFEEHKLKWARVRYGDEERVFRADSRRRR